MKNITNLLIQKQPNHNVDQRALTLPDKIFLRIQQNPHKSQKREELSTCPDDFAKLIHIKYLRQEEKREFPRQLKKLNLFHNKKTALNLYIDWVYSGF